jgi:hypothetical protein
VSGAAFREWADQPQRVHPPARGGRVLTKAVRAA